MVLKIDVKMTSVVVVPVEVAHICNNRMFVSVLIIYCRCYCSLDYHFWTIRYW